MIYQNSITIEMEKGIHIKDITALIEYEVRKSNIKTGLVNIFVTGSTGSVTTIEYESGVVEDLKRIINDIAPEGDIYKHELAWHDGNGHSHIQAALLGPSLTVPVNNFSLLLGTWQQIVVINHDNKRRKRNVAITVTGE